MFSTVFRNDAESLSVNGGIPFRNDAEYLSVTARNIFP